MMACDSHLQEVGPYKDEGFHLKLQNLNGIIGDCKLRSFLNP